MILSDGTDTREVVAVERGGFGYSPKFGGDPMAFYLWLLMLDGMGDEHYGDTDYGWADRFGRHVLYGDSVGFVYRTRFASEGEAVDALNADYADWLEAEDY